MAAVNARCAAGFSLLELMLALALAALLWGMALSAWQPWQRRSQRDRACLALQQLAAREQEWLAWHGRYTDALAPLGCDASGCVSGDPAAPRYRIEVEHGTGPSGAWFRLRAEPLGAQRDDLCGVLVLDHLGAASAARGGVRCCGAALH